MIEKGFRGIWSSMAMCSQNYYMAGAQIQYEPFQGSGDDRDVVGLKIICRDSTYCPPKPTKECV